MYVCENDMLENEWLRRLPIVVLPYVLQPDVLALNKWWVGRLVKAGMNDSERSHVDELRGLLDVMRNQEGSSNFPFKEG